MSNGKRPVRGQFHQTFFAKQKVAGAQKNCCSILPMIKTTNFKLQLAPFFTNRQFHQR